MSCGGADGIAVVVALLGLAAIIWGTIVVIKKINRNNFPPIFGYNEVNAKSNAQVLVRVKETGHPLVVVGEHGKGRTFTYMSDPAPHWGINFELWEGYDAFWQQAYRWVEKKEAK